MIKVVHEHIISKDSDDDAQVAISIPPERQRSFTVNDVGAVVASNSVLPSAAGGIGGGAGFGVGSFNNINNNSSSSSSSSSSSNSNNNNNTSTSGYGKLFHYLNEMKKELEISQSKNNEGRLEMQRLRERNQQLTDQLLLEQSKNGTLEDRLERAKREEVKLRLKLAQLQESGSGVVSSGGGGGVGGGGASVGTIVQEIVKDVALLPNEIEGGGLRLLASSFPSDKLVSSVSVSENKGGIESTTAGGSGRSRSGSSSDERKDGPSVHPNDPLVEVFSRHF
jgi:hypothetical protein